MRIPSLFELLHGLEDRDYWNAGLIGNPAYSGLHRGDEDEEMSVPVPREALERKVKESIKLFVSAQTDADKPKHLYLFSREGGAGKSHTQRQMRDYCGENDIAFVEIWHEDWDHGNISENLPYIMGLMGTDRLIAFLECDHRWEIYDQLCKIEGVFVIGSGHEPKRELRTVIDRFEILDIERDYPLADSQLLRELYLEEQTLRFLPEQT